MKAIQDHIFQYFSIGDRLSKTVEIKLEGFEHFKCNQSYHFVDISRVQIIQRSNNQGDHLITL